MKDMLIGSCGFDMKLLMASSSGDSTAAISALSLLQWTLPRLAKATFFVFVDFEIGLLL